MEYSLNDQVLTIALPLRVDTSTVSAAESDIAGIVSGQRFDKLVFDASGLEYISSVGLRLVLKYKKEYPSLCVENASSEVYDIFEMTGFTQILDVRKRFREISIEGCPLIGKGAYGKVYRLSPDSIVKSFYRGNPLSDIERERNLAKLAFILGIPTAISYDVVKIKEEKLGSVYELIASDSLLDTFLKNPDKYDEYLAEYVKLLKQMGSTHVDSKLIPSYKEDLEVRLSHCNGIVDPALLSHIRSFLDTMPEGDYLLHGDCHFKNIFVTPDGPLLIDMDTLSKGDPLYELSCLYKTYVTFDVIDPGNSMEFFGVDGAFCAKLFHDLFEGLHKDDPDKERKYAIVAATGWFMYLSHMCSKPEKNQDRIAKASAILAEKLDALK